MSARVCRILLVDDSDDDRVLLLNALRRLGASADLLGPLSDGAQVVAYLTGQGDYSNRDIYPLPDLLVLDLKMPGIGGYEVLSWLKKQPSAPVTVVLSDSDRPQDISRATGLGARGYFVKPPDFRNWLAVVRAMLEHCGCATGLRE